MTSSSSSPSASPPPRPLLTSPPRPLLTSPPSPSRSHSASPSPKLGRLLHLPRPLSKSSPPKKSPPLPWTHQETLALIQAYQEKWYSLKKGQLKSFQWEEVSITVAAHCGFDEPSKTATQCRHKIEKLRKRYRSEMQKSYPYSWQYFDLMDEMERGPMPLTARPVTVANSFPNNVSTNSNNDISNFSHGYGSLHPRSTDYYNNNGGGYSDGSDDSDEKWNMSHGAAAASVGNKSKSINNILRGDVRSGVRSTKGVAVVQRFGGGRVRGMRNPMNGKKSQYYDGDDSNDDNDSDDEEEEKVMVEEGEGGGAGMELAAEVRCFTERFMGMERRKIEMMQETERYRMEMEKKRLDMIVEAHRKMVDTIGRAFGAHKRVKMAQES